MSTVFSYTNSKGENPFWPGIQYAGKLVTLFCIDRCLGKQMSCLPGETLPITSAWSSATCLRVECLHCSGPDPLRPEKPSDEKQRSEQMLYAATLDLNDCKGAAGLQQGLASSLHLSPRVRPPTAKPPSERYLCTWFCIYMTILKRHLTSQNAEFVCRQLIAGVRYL